MDWTHRLRLRHLGVLLSLAETRNVSRSAALLHISQPALSKWLKDLESDVGLPLFERHSRGLRPTAYGESLIEHAKRIGNDLDRARDDMSALREGSSGRVVVGGSGAAISTVVPAAVLSLLRAMPHASIDLIESTMDHLVEQLVQREIDVAVGRSSAKYRNADVAFEDLYVERLHFVVRAGHPLTKQRRLGWPDLKRYRWIVWTRDIPSRDLLDIAMGAAEQDMPKDRVQSNSTLAAVSLIVDSDMIAVASDRSIERYERVKMLRRLSVPLDAYGTVAMYWRTDTFRSVAVEEMLAALRTASMR